MKGSDESATPTHPPHLNIDIERHEREGERDDEPAWVEDWQKNEKQSRLTKKKVDKGGCERRKKIKKGKKVKNEDTEREREREQGAHLTHTFQFKLSGRG